MYVQSKLFWVTLRTSNVFFADPYKQMNVFDKVRHGIMWEWSLRHRTLPESTLYSQHCDCKHFRIYFCNTALNHVQNGFVQLYGHPWFCQKHRDAKRCVYVVSCSDFQEMPQVFKVRYRFFLFFRCSCCGGTVSICCEE